MLTEVVYEDSEILVVDKPAGLAAQTARAGLQDVVSELKNYLGRTGNPFRGMSGQALPYLGIIHRLDQPVEGLLVFAKDRRTAAFFNEQLRRQGEGGMFSKQYYAVLWGKPAAKEGELTDYLYKNQENKAVIIGSEADEQSRSRGQGTAQKAVLQYRILETLEIPANAPNTSDSPEVPGLALADIHIDTGRFHQIRAQMAHAGMPLLGDRKYGNEETEAAARMLGIRNVALCAYRLEFVHPVTGEKMCFRIKPKNKAFSFFSQL